MITTSHAAPPPDGSEVAALLAWYDRHARILPWRVGPEARRRGRRPDPYHIWLSEIMLQQTTVRAVGPYFLAFVARWPTLADLAAADADEVMRAWAGLGYYSRARNLKKCAEALVRDHGGRFPQSAGELRDLPGIGPYTSAAIAAIAFDAREPVVDGNVERVIARLHAIDQPLPDAKPAIRRIVDQMTPGERPGDFAQAMMDLGATICTPRTPACALCPLSTGCTAAAAGTAATFPRKAAKPDKPVRYGAAFVLYRADGAVLLRKRPDKGLLGGMAEVPTGRWLADTALLDDVSAAPVTAAWRRAPDLVSHTFTHFHLRLAVHSARHAGDGPLEGWWSRPEEVAGEALPTVMRKVLAVAGGP